MADGDASPGHARPEAADGAPVDADPRGWGLLWGVLVRHRRGLLIGTALGLFWTAGKVAVPQLVRLAIDEGIIAGGSLLAWASAIMAVAVVAGVFSGIRRYYAFRESRLVESTLREELFAHLQGLDVSYHDRSQTGQLMSRASSDLGLLQGFMVMVPLTITNFAIILASVVVMFVSDPLLAALALIPIPFVNVVTKMFATRVHPASLEVQQEQAQLAAVVEETVSGVRVVKGFGAEAVQEAKVRTEADDIRAASMRAARIRSRYMPLIDLLPSIGLITVLGVGGHRVLDGQMTVGAFVAFNAYLVLLVQPLRTIGMTIAFGQRAATALVRIDEVLSTAPAVASPDEPAPLPARRNDEPAGGVGAVRFRDVTFSYAASGEGRVVLDHLTFEVRPGETVALVGATGSGKSTIARLLLRFYDPQAGAILLDGVDVRELSLPELRRAVSVVFEDTLLFNDTVAANIAFARPDADHAAIRSAAEAAGAHEFIGELPDGYDTVLGERGYSLSGGQRQRIAIARAIVADPRVLVLDDATSAVDPSKEHEIRSALARAMGGRTTIVIAHRPATIELASRVLLVDGGRVVAEGTHRELLAVEPRYRDVLAAADRDDVDATPGVA